MQIYLSNAAKEKLQEYKIENKPINVRITGFSWGGAEINIVPVERSEEDKLFEVDGFDIIVSDEIAMVCKGLEIDFVKGYFSSGFDIVPIY